MQSIESVLLLVESFLRDRYNSGEDKLKKDEIRDFLRNHNAEKFLTQIIDTCLNRELIESEHLKLLDRSPQITDDRRQQITDRIDRGSHFAFDYKILPKILDGG